MGIYDRDYYREERGGLTMRTPRTVVTWLILINVGIYLVDGLFFADTHWLSRTLSATDQTLRHPWLWWQLLTSGFAHDTNPLHVGFNMLQLWFLGRAVESRYGSMEFLRVYLVMVVVGSLSWAVPVTMAGPQFVIEGGQPIPVLHTLCGASGAVSGVVFLFVLNFPRQTLVLFPIPIPIKAWVVGVLLIVYNVLGAVNQYGDIAFGVHLAGVVFASLYFYFGWNLGRLMPGRVSLDQLKPRPRLRVHDPGADEPAASDLRDEVDRILEKIHQQGEASLTRKERRTLQTASRQYQKKRQESNP